MHCIVAIAHPYVSAVAHRDLRKWTEVALRVELRPVPVKQATVCADHIDAVVLTHRRGWANAGRFAPRVTIMPKYSAAIGRGPQVTHATAGRMVEYRVPVRRPALVSTGNVLR